MTDLGKLLVEFPIDPQLGKMMLMGMTLKCLEPSVIIACCSAYKDPCKIFFLLILDIFMRKCSVEIGSIYSRIKPLILNFHKTGIQTFKVLQHIPLIGTSLSLDKPWFYFHSKLLLDAHSSCSQQKYSDYWTFDGIKPSLKNVIEMIFFL